jgi:predicted  nucleic acid-binding Zn-ribbon protein
MHPKDDASLVRLWVKGVALDGNEVPRDTLGRPPASQPHADGPQFGEGPSGLNVDQPPNINYPPGTFDAEEAELWQKMSPEMRAWLHSPAGKDWMAKDRARRMVRDIPPPFQGRPTPGGEPLPLNGDMAIDEMLDPASVAHRKSLKDLGSGHDPGLYGRNRLRDPGLYGQQGGSASMAMDKSVSDDDDFYRRFPKCAHQGDLTMPRSALRPAPPAAPPLRSSARSVLASAIARRDEAKQEALEAHAAVDRAKAHVQAAEDHLAKAKTRQDEMRRDQARRFEDAARTGIMPEPSADLVHARTEYAAAEDQLWAARDVLSTLEATLSLPDDALKRAESQVKSAAHAVLWEAAALLLERARQHQDALIKQRLVLDHLRRTCTPFHRLLKMPGVPDQRPALVAAVNSFLLLVVDMPAIAPPDMFDQSGLEPWKRALETLMNDPDAPLPEVPS